MAKIYINLNPRKEKVENVILQRVVSFTPLISLAVLFLFIVIFILNFVVVAKINSFNGLKKEWEKNSQESSQLAEIRKEATQLTRELDSLRKITTPATDVVRLMEDIFSVLPQNLWFKDLSFKEGNLYLQGYVVAWGEDYLISLVDKFIKPLKEREYFSSKFKKADLRHSQRKIFYGVEVLEYSIECKN